MTLFCGIIFWGAFAFVVYTYFLYPILVAVAARFFAWRPRSRAGFQPTVSIVLAGHNEAASLPGRIANLLAQDYPADKFDIILIDDGSTDDTGEVMKQFAREHAGRIKAIVLPNNDGKACALNAGMEIAGGEVVVFADARQRFEPQVLARLAENFADKSVGAASGELMFTTGDLDAAASGAAALQGGGVAAQMGIYWKYEKWIRRSEAALDSMLGATGAIYAIRRGLFRPLPDGTLLDDFLIPMRIVLRGHRAIFDGRARAWDQPSAHGRQEFRRKVRTLAGNYQAFALEPRLLSPWRNQTTWLQVWSHKVFRLWVPFGLALMLLSSLLLSLMGHPHFFGPLLAAQLVLYVLALWGWRREAAGRKQPNKVVSLAYTFTVLNLAAALAAWARLKQQDHRRLWRKPAENRA